MHQPTCEACGAAIIWSQTTKGNLMPLDAEPTPSGNILLDTSPTTQPRLAEATVLGARKALEARDAGRTLYKSHFATCPKAGEFRRKKR